MGETEKRIGAWYCAPGVCEFCVWAPLLGRVDLSLIAPEVRLIPMEADAEGYWHATVKGLEPGARYFYAIGRGALRPDPASAFQPDGVHKSSAVVDHGAFLWHDALWKDAPLSSMIIYEVHVGTFTPDGTLDAAAGRIGDLAELGVNAVELMPVAQFPGERNWGYDGVHLFAVQNSYGGPDAMKRFVDACHQAGLAVVLDVVYNHLGPEGNYLGAFGPYFTDRYKGPWGEAMNFDGPHSDGVRNFFVSNALCWFEHFHVDGLRIDAVHAFTDMSARPFLAELAAAVEGSCAGRRKRWLVAESDLNDTKILRPRAAGGFGLDAQWCDDFHHALHALLTGERTGYYEDFGEMEDFRKALAGGFVFSGQYSRWRKRRWGNSSADISSSQFVVFSQNHDQAGNRARGERLSALTGREQLKLAASAALLSPYVPLLFMGEEYGELSPFLYFVSFGDRALADAVFEGRRGAFGAQAAVPDPQAPATFLESKLAWERRREGGHASLCAFYKALIALRKKTPALSTCSREGMNIFCDERTLTVCFVRTGGGDAALCCLNFNSAPTGVHILLPGGNWKKLLDSAEPQWLGPGPRLPEYLAGPDAALPMQPFNAAVYTMER